VRRAVARQAWWRQPSGSTRDGALVQAAELQHKERAAATQSEHAQWRHSARTKPGGSLAQACRAAAAA